jgi:hypothetical protein
MTGDASAYAALGLEPDADPAAIEQAYKRLIKEHHPDREGGDARRAAEINRAYRELRTHRNLKDPLELNDEWTPPTRERLGWLFTALLLACATIALLLTQSPLPRLAALDPATGGPRHPIMKAVQHDPMDQPLNLAAIDAAAAEALQLSRTRDEMALASTSADCHRQLRSGPTLLQLDRCAAFDAAVVQLENRDPLRDQGPFSEIAVTGRLLSGATGLSDDSVAIDGRLDRIRLQVELALANAAAPAAASN